MDYSFLQNFYCKITIDDHPLIPKNIKYCVIREWIFDILPRIEIAINDDGYLTEVFPIKDNSVLFIEIGVNPDDENIFGCEFNIVNKVIDEVNANKSTVITLTGVLKTNFCFFPIKNRSFKNMNSQQVLSLISKELGLKFNKNINLNTSDVMTWLQVNISNFDFIKHVLKRSYSNEDVLFCYADVNNQLNYTSLKSEIKKETKIAKYSLENYTKYSFADENDLKTIWYKSFNIANYTNDFNRQFGYGMKGSYYDLQNNKNVVVDKNYFPLTEMSFNDNNGQVVNKNVFPILNNVYSDYFKAMMQNKYYKNVFGISMQLSVNALNKINLFDIIDLQIESLLNDEKDEVQSGEYIVAGITHQLTNVYKKEISIHRNGYNKPLYL